MEKEDIKCLNCDHINKAPIDVDACATCNNHSNFKDAYLSGIMNRKESKIEKEYKEKEQRTVFKIGVDSNLIKKTITLEPTPEAMAGILIQIIESYSLGNGPTVYDFHFARTEIEKAFRIAYAFWYPRKEEYKLEGYKIVKEDK